MWAHMLELESSPVHVDIGEHSLDSLEVSRCLEFRMKHHEHNHNMDA